MKSSFSATFGLKKTFTPDANTCVSKSVSEGVIEIWSSPFLHRCTSNIYRFDFHNRRYRSVRCATETNRAVRNSGSDVWQSTAIGTDQDDLAAA